jgi:hypothetical protein
MKGSLSLFFKIIGSLPFYVGDKDKKTGGAAGGIPRPSTAEGCPLGDGWSEDRPGGKP